MNTKSLKKFLLVPIFVILGTLGFFVVRRDDFPIVSKGPRSVAMGDGKAFTGRDLLELPHLQYDLKSPNVTYPWKNDSTCGRFAVRLGVGLPRIFLISYPRSGNTWTRYLLEGATGFFTGSKYFDVQLYEMGYLGELEEPLNGTTLFIKSHLFKFEKYDPSKYPAVLVIRNPSQSIESFVSRKAGGADHFYKGSEQDFENLDMVFTTQLKSWEHIATIMLNNSINLHLLVYENLKADPINEITKIMKFFAIPIDPERLACLAKYSEGFTNRGQPEFNPFSANQSAEMMAAVRRVNALVVGRGFPPLPFVAEQDTFA